MRLLATYQGVAEDDELARLQRGRQLDPDELGSHDRQTRDPADRNVGR